MTFHVLRAHHFAKGLAGSLRAPFKVNNGGRIIISNTLTLGKLVIKCSRKQREDLWRYFYKSSRGLRGHLITNFPNVMVFWEFDLCSCTLMRDKLEIYPVWGKLVIKWLFTWAGQARLAGLSLVTKIVSWPWLIISINFMISSQQNKTKRTKLSNVIPVVFHGQYKVFF